MKNITPSCIAKICDGRYFGSEDISEIEVTSISTDSRNISKGGVFVAIRGERVDGNKFVIQTYKNGAICCISELSLQEFEQIYGKDNINICDVAFIQVSSCYQALKDIAEYYRIVCGTKIIGITGSVGKTTTKEMIADVLSEKFNTLKTQGNFNNEVGVPLTLFRLREEHEIAVVEMGINEFGEMTRLSKIVKPDICVITNIGQCHLENLGDRDGVLKAKTEIFTYMAKGGRVYLNGDDDKLVQIKEAGGVKPIFFGIGINNDIYAENITSKGLAGTVFDAVYDNLRIKIHVPLPGKHMIINALAAIAIGIDMGMEPEKIASGIAKFKPVGGHSSIIETDKLTIMDDCYNANPVSMKAGIDILSDVQGRKAAIIGDMFELGTDEKKMHYEIGQYAAEKRIDCIICIGELAKEYIKGAKDAGKQEMVYYYNDLDTALLEIGNIIKDGDAVLVKASHAMKFEKVVEVLKGIGY